MLNNCNFESSHVRIKILLNKPKMNRKLNLSILILISVSLISSCITPQYFHDQASCERQKELKKQRSGNIFTGVGLVAASVFMMAAFEIDAGLVPEGREF